MDGPDDLPFQTIRPSSRRSSPSLHSQATTNEAPTFYTPQIVTLVRGQLKKALSWKEQERIPDRLEQWLQTRSGNKKPFLHDYNTIRDHSGDEIFDALVRYFTVRIASSDSSTERESVEVKEPVAQWDLESKTFSQALDIFSHELQAGMESSLRVCAVSLKVPNTLRSKIFSFKEKAFCSIERLNRKYDVPAQAITLVAEKEWDPGYDWIRASLDRAISRYRRTWSLPSEKKAEIGFSLSRATTLEFNWVTVSPVYRGDFYEYIWQRQTKHPPCESVSLSTRDIDPGGSRNIFITFSSTIEWANGEECTELLRAFAHEFEEVLPPLFSNHQTCSIESAYVGTIFSIFALLIAAIKNFLESVSISSSNLSYMGRKRPSGSKLHYLSHLDDSRKVAAIGVENARLLLSKIVTTITGNALVNQDLVTKAEAIEEDLEFLATKLEDLKTEMDELREMLKEKLDLRQIKRTFILTILAAIYLPFSFMTSFYGMNVSDPIWPSKHKNTTATVATRDTDPVSTNSSVISQDGTVAIVAAIASSGSHLWTFKSYWYITVPVTVATIFLPLIIGAMLRGVSRFTYHYRGYWRLLVVLILVPGKVAIDAFSPLDIMFIIYMICFGLSAITLLVRSFWLSRHRLIWSGFAFSLLMYFSLYWFDVLGLVGAQYLDSFIPLGYLFLFWIRHDLRDFLVPKIKEFGKRRTVRRLARNTGSRKGMDRPVGPHDFQAPLSLGDCHLASGQYPLSSHDSASIMRSGIEASLTNAQRIAEEGRLVRTTSVPNPRSRIVEAATARPRSTKSIT